MSVIWVKDPADVAWYEFDWSGAASNGTPWLPTGVTIASYTVTVDANLTKANAQLQGPLVLIQVSGGTAGTESVVTCSITTSETPPNTYDTQKSIFIQTRTS